MFCGILIAAIPINKQLYSFSYVCFSGGAAGIVFSGFYILVGTSVECFNSSTLIFSNNCDSYLNMLKIKQIDVWGLRTPFLFLEWIGMNAMLVFVMAAEGIFAAFVNGWYYEDPRNSLVRTNLYHLFVYVMHSYLILCFASNI